MTDSHQAPTGAIVVLETRFNGHPFFILMRRDAKGRDKIVMVHDDSDIINSQAEREVCPDYPDIISEHNG